VSSFDDELGNLADHGMSASDTGTYPALGFNPAPGNVGTVSSLAQNFLNVSTSLGQARDAMEKAGQAGGFWEGDAADAFHKDLGKLPDYLSKATSSLGDAGKALDGWSDDLSSMQKTAADYEQQAENAVRSLNQAKSNPDLDLAGRQFDTALPCNRPSPSSTRPPRPSTRPRVSSTRSASRRSACSASIKIWSSKSRTR
jgi:hypothetical protein